MQKPVREPERSKREFKLKMKKIEDEDEEDYEEDDLFDEQRIDSIDKSIDFYEDNIDEPDSPIPVKTPKKLTVEEVRIHVTGWNIFYHFS